MGNLFSSNKREFQELSHRLSNLEFLDRNKDGLITANEFEAWKKTQQENLQEFRTQIINFKDKML